MYESALLLPFYRALRQREETGPSLGPWGWIYKRRLKWRNPPRNPSQPRWKVTSIRCWFFFSLNLDLAKRGLQTMLGSAKRQWESKRLLSSLNKMRLKSWSSEAEWVGRQREHGLNKARDPWLHSHLELGRADSCLITKKAGLATGWSWSSCQCRAVILNSWDRRTNACRWQGLGFAIRWAWAQMAAVPSSTTVAKLLHCSKPQLSWKLNKIMSV